MHKLSHARRDHIKKLAENKRNIPSIDNKQTGGCHGDQDAPQPSISGVSRISTI